MPSSFSSLSSPENDVKVEQHPNSVPDQPLAPLPGNPPVMATQMDQQQGLHGAPGNVEVAPTRPLHKDTLSARPEVAYKDRESRLAGIITILILIATLLLLGFSIYLATELGFLSIPGIKQQIPSPTVPVNSIRVPNLITLNYAQAKALAEQ